MHRLLARTEELRVGGVHRVPSETSTGVRGDPARVCRVSDPGVHRVTYRSRAGRGGGRACKCSSRQATRMKGRIPRQIRVPLHVPIRPCMHGKSRRASRHVPSAGGGIHGRCRSREGHGTRPTAPAYLFLARTSPLATSYLDRLHLLYLRSFIRILTRARQMSVELLAARDNGDAEVCDTRETDGARWKGEKAESAGREKAESAGKEKAENAGREKAAFTTIITTTILQLPRCGMRGVQALAPRLGGGGGGVRGYRRGPRLLSVLTQPTAAWSNCCARLRG